MWKWRKAGLKFRIFGLLGKSGPDYVVPKLPVDISVTTPGPRDVPPRSLRLPVMRVVSDLNEAVALVDERPSALLTRSFTPSRKMLPGYVRTGFQLDP